MRLFSSIESFLNNINHDILSHHGWYIAIDIIILVYHKCCWEGGYSKKIISPVVSNTVGSYNCFHLKIL